MDLSDLIHDAAGSAELMNAFSALANRADEGTAETPLEFTRLKNVRFLSGERPVPAWPTVERILA